MKPVAGLVLAFVCSAAFAVEPVQRTITFDERVQAQTAIERVYYRNQLGTASHGAEEDR